MIRIFGKGKYRKSVQGIANALDKENVSQADFLAVLPTFLSVIFKEDTKHLEEYIKTLGPDTLIIIRAAQRAGTIPKESPRADPKERSIS